MGHPLRGPNLLCLTQLALHHSTSASEKTPDNQATLHDPFWGPCLQLNGVSGGMCLHHSPSREEGSRVVRMHRAWARQLGMRGQPLKEVRPMMGQRQSLVRGFTLLPTLGFEATLPLHFGATCAEQVCCQFQFAARDLLKRVACKAARLQRQGLYSWEASFCNVFAVFAVLSSSRGSLLRLCGTSSIEGLVFTWIFEPSLAHLAFAKGSLQRTLCQDFWGQP
jgi:hypothetical protein